MRILLVEDDSELAMQLESGLAEVGFRVVVERTFAGGESRAMLSSFDVMILDVMLHGGSGLDLCRIVRDAGIGTRVLMLTARDSVDDRVRGLDCGADDYLTKPFAFRELVARLHALGRRPRPALPEHVTVADLEVEFRGHRVRRAGREIELTTKEFRLLDFLVRRRGEVSTRAAITAYVWEENHALCPNLLDVLVRRLRRKIDDDFDTKLIHTLRHAGYRLGA